MALGMLARGAMSSASRLSPLRHQPTIGTFASSMADGEGRGPCLLVYSQDHLPSCQVHRGADEPGEEDRHLAKKSVEEPQGERQANTDEKRGHKRHVELEAWPFDADVARHTPEPTQLVGSQPEHQAYDSQEHADADQHFTEVFHSKALLYRFARA